MKTYAETIIPKAADAHRGWKGAEAFINIITDIGAEMFDSLNDAAEDAICYNSYLGTLHLVPGAAPVWLDLTDHGHAINTEAKQEAKWNEEHNLDGNDGNKAGRTL